MKQSFTIITWEILIFEESVSIENLNYKSFLNKFSCLSIFEFVSRYCSHKRFWFFEELNRSLIKSSLATDHKSAIHMNILVHKFLCFNDPIFPGRFLRQTQICAITVWCTKLYYYYFITDSPFLSSAYLFPTILFISVKCKIEKNRKDFIIITQFTS